MKQPSSKLRDIPPPRAGDRGPWRHGEPTLAEVMADPLVHLVMKRDRLAADDVWPVLNQARARLEGAPGAGDWPTPRRFAA